MVAPDKLKFITSAQVAIVSIAVGTEVLTSICLVSIYAAVRSAHDAVQ